MKAIQLFILFFITGKFEPCFSQSAISNENFNSDLENYRNTIVTKHKNAFTKISKEEFSQKVDSLISIIPFIDKYNFAFELFKINSFIEDEHTILFPDNEIEMPFKFELFDEGMSIISADSINQMYLLYRVLSIDNNSWGKIDSLFKLIIKRDNPSYFKFFETYYFSNVELLKGMGIINKLSSMQIKLLSPKGDTITTTINSHNKSEKVLWVNATQFKNLMAYSRSSNYWYSYDKKSKILYFNYQHCSEEQNLSFKTFNKYLFQKIDSVKPNKIVLDLRFNGGGNSGVLKPFIKSIKESDLNTKDRFFVLLGRKVMSSSLMNVIDLKKSTNATFVGETTGGNINHFGELKSIYLPNSKMKVTYSTKFWENWKDHSGSFVPDIEASHSLFDFIKSNDEALEIISLKRNN